MKKLLTIALLCLSAVAFAQTSDFFTPVKPSALRLPSVPLIANDPYFCVWSPYDHLYDGTTTYFSGAAKPITGILRVDGECYRFMGQCLSTLVPMATEEKWDARYLMNQTPATGWTDAGFDDSSWRTGKGAFGGGDGAYGNIGTTWSGDNTDVYIRRSFTLDEVDVDGEYFVTYKHDDVCELYLNGQLIAQHGNEWHPDGLTISVPASLLHQGDNLFAVHCHNTKGGAYIDFGLFKDSMKTATQQNVQVLATNTYYDFTCGPIDLNVVFTSPQLIDNLEVESFPGTYISYQVASNDGQEHDVQIYLESSAQLGVSSSNQSTTSSRTKASGYVYTKGGTSSQDVLHTTGDGQINWGYLYMYSELNDVKDITLGDHATILATFQNSGDIEPTKSTVSKDGGIYPAMSYIHNIGTIGTTPVSSYMLMAYDDLYSINFLGERLKAYWTTQHSRTSFTSRMKTFYQEYEPTMLACRNLDERIYNDGFEAGGYKYAEILSGVYRQTMAAHKLVQDEGGDMLWMSRENNSGGFINTVDITYPCSPLFLVYNAELCRALVTPQFEYAYRGKWTKGFAAHDLGPYPMATGQTYGGDMPLEESADMVILAAMLQKITGNTEYTQKYWNLLTTWTDYLVDNGKNPTNQLCTDDFMGPSEHNINLSLKSILGIYSYIEMCKMLGYEEQAEAYKTKVQPLENFWKSNAVTKTKPYHSRLAYGGANSSWSEKYNMVWDMMWRWDIFADARNNDMDFYQTKMLTYGLPLDSRGEYNKNDWHFWVGAMSRTPEEFETYVDPMYRYVNETPTRVPLSDYHDANTGERRGYMARPVVAGYWMKVLVDKFMSGELTSIENVEAGTENIHTEGIYNTLGQKLSKPEKGINIINGKKILK